MRYIGREYMYVLTRIDKRADELQIHFTEKFEKRERTSEEEYLHERHVKKYGQDIIINNDTAYLVQFIGWKDPSINHIQRYKIVEEIPYGKSEPINYILLEE